MTWIRVDHEALRDDKIGKLADALDVPLPYAFGLAVAVWCGMSIHAPDGLLSEIADRSLESWSGWEGKRGKFAPAFRELYQREDGHLSGWQERQGKLIERAAKDRERHRGKSKESPQSFRGGSAEIPALRNDNDTERSTDVVVGGEPSIEEAIPKERQPVAVLLTSAANQGITAKYGEQPSPLRFSHPGSLEAADEILSRGVPVLFARDAFYSAAKGCPLVRPPQSLKYFLRQVLDAWDTEQSRTQAKDAATPKVIALVPADRRTAEIRATKEGLLRGVPT
jgi:hypothetical protein